MSAPNYTELNRSPESLLTWLKSNIIATGLLGNSKIKDTPEYLELHLNQRKGKMDNKDMDVYYLKQSDKNGASKALNSYICDYTKNDVESCRLGREANFCFTITMNGCTFGIGSATGDGTVLVTHANKASSKTQGVDQFDQTVGAHGSNKVSMMTPSMYRSMSPGLTATTFGIRTSKGWKFYFQSYRSENGIFRCYGVMPIPTNQFAG